MSSEKNTGSFHLNSDMLKEINEEDIIDILTYEDGYNLNRDDLIVRKESVRYVPQDTYIQTYYEKDWYNTHKRYRPVTLHEHVDFVAFYTGTLTPEQIKEFHAYRSRSRNGVEHYIMHGRVYASCYGFDCRERAKRKYDVYHPFTKELGMKIFNNIQERMGILSDSTEQAKEEKVVQTKLAVSNETKEIKKEPEEKKPTKMHQSTLEKYMPTDGQQKKEKQKKSSEQQNTQQKTEEDQIEKIIRNIKKRHAVVSDVDVVEVKKVKNKQNGRPECHFIAEAEISDYDAEELDEDGNYPTKQVLITGIKSGKYFESKIVEDDDEFVLQ